MPCEALLQDLGAEHGMALVLLELALGVLDVVAAALHLRPALAQAVLLILQALLDDLGAVREALAEVLRALLGHELGLQGVELQDARVLVHEVHEVGREDVHARGRLVGLLLLGSIALDLPHALAAEQQVEDAEDAEDGADAHGDAEAQEALVREASGLEAGVPERVRGLPQEREHVHLHEVGADDLVPQLTLRGGGEVRLDDVPEVGRPQPHHRRRCVEQLHPACRRKAAQAAAQCADKSREEGGHVGRVLVNEPAVDRTQDPSAHAADGAEGPHLRGRRAQLQHEEGRHWLVQGAAK
mmetsp:Transcript_65944/g.204554  ORF Transcript_65944/g.204554 Transcript_65944/m.204554 type:complete len:299 (-) Transcript_65944:134-1030(-)